MGLVEVHASCSRLSKKKKLLSFFSYFFSSNCPEPNTSSLFDHTIFCKVILAQKSNYSLVLEAYNMAQLHSCKFWLIPWAETKHEKIIFQVPTEVFANLVHAGRLYCDE